MTENAYKEAYRAKAAGVDPSVVRLITMSFVGCLLGFNRVSVEEWMSLYHAHQSERLLPSQLKFHRANVALQSLKPMLVLNVPKSFHKGRKLQTQLVPKQANDRMVHQTRELSLETTQASGSLIASTHRSLTKHEKLRTTSQRMMLQQIKQHPSPPAESGQA